MVTWQCEAVSSTCGGRIPIGASLLDRSMAATALPRDGVALQTVVRVPLFAIFSQPPLPRFLQFPHSSRHLLLPFGTIPAPCCPSNPSPPFFLLLPSTSTFPMDRPQRLRHLIQPGDKDQLRLIHSVGQRPRRPARQRHAVLPPSRGPPTQEHLMNT